MKTLEFGLDTFLPVTVDGAGLPVSGDQVIRNTVQEAVVAETVGIDSFNIGEHYRREFMDSASHVVLAAIASRTERIRLGTAVTVLSTQDPVRLYTDFARLDAVSNGRAQLIVGRGSLTTRSDASSAPARLGVLNCCRRPLTFASWLRQSVTAHTDMQHASGPRSPGTEAPDFELPST